MTAVHYTQTLELGEKGRLECTRDDTPEEVNFHLVAWKDGRQTHEYKIRYNIMFDYARYQNWWNGRLVEDFLRSPKGYGHLLAEGCSELTCSDNFEPVSPFGCEMFRLGRFGIREITLPENSAEVKFDYSPYPPYGIQQTGRIIEVDYREELIYNYERSRLEAIRFNPVTAREARLQFFKEYSEWLQTEVPIDMSMVD